MYIKHFLVAVLLLVAIISSHAQSYTRHKIALFTPLYLDSAFDGGYNYRFNKTFPKFLHPGLEFYEGAQAALDSLNKAGAPLEVFVYDSRSKRMPITQHLNSKEFADMDLIIGHASTDVRVLADAALKNKIPFISATLPNDAGITANPYYVVLNSTLRTHAEGIYQYLVKYHKNDKIIVFRKNGAQENQIRDYLQELSRSASTRLRINFQEIGTGFTQDQISTSLDSSGKTVCIAGSLDEAFGQRLVQQLANLSNDYLITIMGMPTWDGFNLTKPEFKKLEIIYTTPFNYRKWSPLGSQLASRFEATFGARPTDMYYRGYETMMRFALLLLDTKDDMASNLSRRGNAIFTQFDIQPVFLNKQNMELDYFENKKLYYVRTVNGTKIVQ
jgi:ABC-type branched-subunit amino acid transport system substrate-binding protein